jgi:hypothetical protein
LDRLALKDLKDHKAYQAQPDRRVHKDLVALMVMLVQMDLLDRKDRRELLGPKDRRELLGPKDRRDHKVRRATQDQVDHKGLVAQKDHLAELLLSLHIQLQAQLTKIQVRVK